MQPLWKGVWRFLRTLRVELPYKCTNFTTGYSSEENENTNSKDICIPMFKVALFIIAKIWKKPMCLSRDEWKRCEIYIHAFTHRNTHTNTLTNTYIQPKRKKNETLPVATICMDIESIMLSEINQRKTNTAWYPLYVEPKK